MQSLIPFEKLENDSIIKDITLEQTRLLELRASIEKVFFILNVWSDEDTGDNILRELLIMERLSCDKHEAGVLLALVNFSRLHRDDAREAEDDET